MRRRTMILGSLALAFAPAVAAAGAPKPFDPQAFAAAQEAGRGIVVAVNATW